MEESLESRPRACFEVEKVIGISSDGSYQVQWAPAWVSKFHLVGCEHLIEEFIQQQSETVLQQQQPEEGTFECEIETSPGNIAERLGDAPQNDAQMYTVPNEFKVEDSGLNITDTFSPSLQETPYSVNQNRNSHAATGESPSVTADISNSSGGIFGPANDYGRQQLNSREKEFVTINMQPCDSNTQLNLMKPVKNAGNNSVVKVIKIEDNDDSIHIMETSPLPCSTLAELTCSSETVPPSSIDSYMELQRVAVEEHEAVSTEQGINNVNTVSIENHYMCEHCENTFSEASALKQHHLLHANGELHVCHFCKKIFCRSSLLTQHLRLHNSGRRYTCSFCKTSFASSISLKQHVCAGERPYTCHLCGKSFAQKSSLDKHMLVHTGSKPYRCEVCGETFNHMYDRNQHILYCAPVTPTNNTSLNN